MVFPFSCWLHILYCCNTKPLIQEASGELCRSQLPRSRRCREPDHPVIDYVQCRHVTMTRKSKNQLGGFYGKGICPMKFKRIDSWLLMVSGLFQVGRILADSSQETEKSSQNITNAKVVIWVPWK
ncbi:expressed protein [Echinococcus multilocularis]|uniref:Expressed protein n=1 Tax=Echinococcus multilocularis TaxID=6211 RepID=A0A068XT90_ECHMU|nr:expressed protein [Echinococcus multilocularis]